MRGLDFRITHQIILDLISETLHEPASDCVIEASSEVLDVLGVGCGIIVLKTLE